ncbi:MAG: Xaa-Pro peptidase family protein [Gemmataceae bacterium]|nr:Xaa-Pro peptidase family protein [Gemmataceae bacterium]
MITADGCRERRRRLLDRLRPAGPVVLTDPIHLRYFANFTVDPISLGAGFGGLLVVRPDGHATLHHDDRLPKSVESAHADDRRTVTWYTGQAPQTGPRADVLRPAVLAAGGRVHDSLDDDDAHRLFGITSELRRRKDPDELDQLRACMAATDAGHAWARVNVEPGMTELDVYAGVCRAVYAHLGHWAVVYGDFTVSDGVKRVGPPTPHVLAAGETFILDFSVVLQGYRSDFTNTLVVGGQPTADQKRLFDLCVSAMRAGEGELKAGATCQSVYDAVRGEFEAAGMADHFPHHAGHGLGLEHPEPPFLVRHSTETLAAGEVVTLEPGLYVADIGGVRIENNYLVTDAGYERLSNHAISLT